MWIKKAVFKNFGRHAVLELDFTQGLIGIFGPNGSGKSTITDGIYAALTNDWSRFAGVKTDNIRDTADEKDESSVYIEAEHDGVGFSLLRSLRPNKSELRIEGREKGIHKATDIQHELEHNLGVDTKLIGIYSFVRQWDMFAFLSQTPGDRARTYQHLCGTGKAEEIYNAVGKMLDDEEFPTELVDNTDEIRASLAAHQSKLKKLEAEIEEVEAKLLSADQTKAAKAIVRRREEHTRLSGLLEGCRDAVAETDAALTKAKKTEKVKAQLVEDLKEGVEELRSGAEEAKTQLSQIERFEKNQARRADLKGRLDKLKLPEEPELHKDDAQLDSLVEQHAELFREEEKLQEQFETMAEGGSALLRLNITAAIDDDGTRFSILKGREPMDEGGYTKDEAVDAVRSELDDLESKLGDPRELEKVEAKLVEAFEKRKPITKKISKIREARKAHGEWSREHERIETKIESLKEQLDAVEEVDSPGNGREELEQLVEDFKTIQKNLESAKEVHAEAREDLATKQAEAKSAASKLKEVADGLAANEVDEDEFKEADVKLVQHHQNELTLSAIRERKKVIDEEIESDEKQLERMEAQLARQQKVIKFGKMLRGVREVMHRQRLPQVVAQENLEDMEEDVNAVLGSFGDPFWVEATADLSFKVHFPGEPTKSADRLSGGQKGVLAVAFRSAVSSLFSEEVGMMCLDEPSAGLDGDNVAHLGEALVKFASQVRGRRQIIMITHSEELKPAFDQVIDIKGS